MMNVDEQQEQIIAHLETLNRQIARQNSLARMFAVGIVYGVGFFIGSALIATVALGVFGPWLAQIPWIHDTFVTGKALTNTP
ncbi:MAG TPA: hypothetical protein VJK73_02125 [Candidatus Paceibacterota bacterium]